MIAAIIATLVIVPLLPMSVMLISGAPSTASDIAVTTVKHIKQREQPHCMLTDKEVICDDDIKD